METTTQGPVPELLPKAVDWFEQNKDAGLGKRAKELIASYQTGTEWEPMQKKLFGFILFSYSMGHGPGVFIEVGGVVAQLGVEVEFQYYAKDWIEYSKKKR